MTEPVHYIYLNRGQYCAGCGLGNGGNLDPTKTTCGRCRRTEAWKQAMADYDLACALGLDKKAMEAKK